jgi:hypothetical protein
VREEEGVIFSHLKRDLKTDSQTKIHLEMRMKDDSDFSLPSSFVKTSVTFSFPAADFSE